MKWLDLNRLGRLEERRQAAIDARTVRATRLTDEELDSEFRAMLVRLRAAMAGTGGVPFVDAMLDLPDPTFGRCAYFLVLLVQAVENGDAAAIERAALRLEGRLREEAPLAWAGYAEGWRESLGRRRAEEVSGE